MGSWVRKIACWTPRKNNCQRSKKNYFALFRAAGRIKVDVYDRTYVDGEDEETTVTQIMVYREDLPSTQLAF